MTIRNLLLKGGGLTDNEYLKDVFLGRADLFRVSNDGEEERVIPFHLGEALEGEGMADRPLRPEDEIRIYPATVERQHQTFNAHRFTRTAKQVLNSRTAPPPEAP